MERSNTVVTDIFIAGASVRAAAYSALRAGLRPWCADLFADADLRAICPVARIESSQYPSGIAAVSDQFPPGPWLYTGALENRPGLISSISSKRPLWGCSAEATEKARAPRKVHELFEEAGIKSPRVLLPGDPLPRNKRWLIKPISGAAGFGIHDADGCQSREVPHCCYGQEHVQGSSCSGLFIGHKGGCLFLGATAQLVGTGWLHAIGFHYAGNVGPLELSLTATKRFHDLGNVVADGCGLRGIFGVDCILQQDVPWPVEINPRYTSSVEVWEYAHARSALALHRCVFEKPNDGAIQQEFEALPNFGHASKVVGKAILYAREAVTIPAATPWSTLKSADIAGFEPPAFADLPSSGDRIEKSHPILTLFATGLTASGCLAELEQRAKSLDQWLYGE